jgi:hypothetical protein
MEHLNTSIIQDDEISEKIPVQVPSTTSIGADEEEEEIKDEIDSEDEAEKPSAG